MDQNSERAAPNFNLLTAFVGIVALVLLLVAIWSILVELFAFGAPAGLPPTNNLQTAASKVEFVDKVAPAVQGTLHVGQQFVDTEADPHRGPQVVWRYYIRLWGIILLSSGILMLIIKRFVEPTNDETSVMHLKGDTRTALRAKGDQSG